MRAQVAQQYPQVGPVVGWRIARAVEARSQRRQVLAGARGVRRHPGRPSRCRFMRGAAAAQTAIARFQCMPGAQKRVTLAFAVPESPTTHTRVERSTPFTGDVRKRYVASPAIVAVFAMKRMARAREVPA